ncbi:MAG: glutamine-hydrolyzing GMP synthase [Deltaproteobacteria bacterium]|nr:glutamine-hydrolyzing GMP synthase [Deltaproteobacteria bacterium]
MSTRKEHDRIAVIDFGGQYAHLIATKFRRLHVLAEIRQPEDPVEAFRPYRGIVLSGSPALASAGEDDGWNRRILDIDLPILGFCFGHQEIAKHYGGRIEHCKREYGPARLRVTRPSPAFDGVPPESTVWMSHGDTVVTLGPGFAEIGLSFVPGDDAPHRNAAIADEQRRRYGFQFHPEVDDTEFGERMLQNFGLRVCRCEPTWTMDRYVGQQIDEIRSRAAGTGVFLLASGGGDSTVCARLLAEALGPKQLHLLHVDNGLMRKDESRGVMRSLERLGVSANLHFVDATDDFLAALDGVVEPEAKRKAIGQTYVDVFDREAERLELRSMLLGQGTIYPDTIETGGTKRADVIKTHHNRVPIIQQLIAQGRVVEPIRELYKTEVRELGETLGIPDDMLWRHPFPGPGLGIRLLCSDGRTPTGWEDAAKTDGVIAETLAGTGLRGRLLPARSVGVKADLRSYELPVLLWGEASFARLLEASTRLFKLVPGINRAVLDLTGRGFTTALPCPATVTRPRLDLLREADDIVMSALARFSLMREIWQCPTVAVPLEVDGRRGEFMIVRPVHSERAMTAKPADLPAPVRDEIRKVLDLPGVVGLGLDLTTKPPGTIEWE